MDRKAAFSLIHDAVDSTETDNSAETDKLESEWDEAVAFSKSPPLGLSAAESSETMGPTCIFMADNQLSLTDE